MKLSMCVLQSGKTVVGLAGLLLLFIMTISSVSASAVPDDLTDLSLEDLANVTITSVSKKAESISQAPASALVITCEDIERYGYRTLAEALRRVIGISVFSDRNYEYVGVRGFSRSGDYNGRILLLIDGHRMNEPVYDSAYFENAFPLDLENISRIEVVKGPGSALWGTNAVLAVINVITRKKCDDSPIRVTEEYGAENNKRLFIGYNDSPSEGLDISCSLSGYSTSGQKSIYFPEFDDPATNNGIAEGIDGESAARQYLSASYSGLRLSFVSGRRKKMIPTGVYYDTVFNASGTYTIDKRSFTELSYEKDVLKKRNGKLLLRLYQDKYDYQGDYISDYGDSVIIVNKDFASARFWGSEARYSQDLSSRLSMTCGLESQDYYRMRQYNYDEDPYYEYADINSSFSSYALYLQTSLALADSMHLVTGVRMDKYSTFGAHWSPRVALISTPSKSTTLKLLYGQAFRAPNDYERNYIFEDEFLPNLSLIPENITTEELVWEQRLSKESRLETSIYRFTLKNIINEVETSEGTVQFQNTGTVTSQGIETQLQTRSKNGSTAYLGLSLLHAWDAVMHEAISNSPRLLASGGLSIPIGSNEFYLTPELQYIGNRKTLTGSETGSLTIANITLTGRLRDSIDVSLCVHNLFNSVVYSAGGVEHIQDRIPQPARTIQLRLTHSF